MQPQQAYEELIRRSRERAVLASCLELLGWDESTYMPRGGVEARGAQMAELTGLWHASASSPRLGELLDIVESSPLAAAPGSPAAVNVRAWRWTHRRATRVPRDLVEQLAAVTTVAQQAWSAALLHDDFATFQPWLDRVVRLKRSEGEYLAEGGEHYDSLLDEFEPGLTTADVATLFDALRPELQALLAAATDGAPQDLAHDAGSLLRRDFPVDRQRILVEAMAAELGFDFDRGRLDPTTHPFYAVIGRGDCRITTRYHPRDLSESVFAMLHELGHGLYEQGLDPEHHGTPLGESQSMSVHESQSRLWERFLGGSRPFWRHFFPRVKELFHDALYDIDSDTFFRAVNAVRPGTNRIRADAVTYDLHILLRFELERALVRGELSSQELPGAWCELSRTYLGVTPANNREGCLQDGHWAAGQFGYFPAYTLGNLYGAQLYERMYEELPDLDEQLSRGEFDGARDWLCDRIYRHGQRYSAMDLLERATGHRLQHGSLVRVLARRQEECRGE